MSGDLDQAINRAVREMLGVEPPADLRAKVIAHIDARPASGFQLPAASFRLPASGFLRFAAPAAAAAVLVLVLVLALARHASSPAQSPVVARGGDQQLPSASANAQHSAPERPVAVQRAIPTSSPQTIASQTRRATVVATTRTDVADQPGAVEPLQAIAPIEVAPIAHSSIAPDPIAVQPLTPITELQIAPLNPPDRRN